MANRYLVGTGARNWSNTAIWSDASGGAGGFSVPTSADAVIFDANSGTGNLTLDVAASVGSLDSSSLTAIVTLVSSVYTFSNYGSLTLNGSYSKFSFTGTAYYYQKGTGTITTNGNLFLTLNRLYIDGVGITVTNGDDCNLGGTHIYPTNGTLDTNGKTITCNSIRFQTGTSTLTCGSSTINLIQFWRDGGTVTFNADTSTFNFNNPTIAVIGTLNSVTGNFYNITRQSVSSIDNYLELWTNITINNLTLTGLNSTTVRALVRSNTIGTPRTITCNGTITASNVDFRDITLAGSANRDLSAITGGSGDCGGNSGITFTPAQKQYFKHTSGAVNFSDATKWFSDFSPRTTAGRVPLPQDDWDFDASSFTGTSTVTVNVPRIGRSCDMSAVANSVTWTLANAIEVYGSYVLGVNITPSGNNGVLLMGRSGFNINLYDKSVYRVDVNCYNGVYDSVSDITTLVAGSSFSITSGAFKFNNYFYTGYRLDVSSASSVYLGNNTLTITSAIAINSSANIFPETSTIVCIGSGSSTMLASLGGKTYNKIQLSGSHTGNFDISGSNTIAELIIDAGRKVRFTAGTTQNIGKATIGAGASIDSITAATHTLNYTGTDIVETDGISVKNSIATPANKWFAGASSTDSGNNSGWLFQTLERVLPVFTEAEVIESTLLSKPNISAMYDESENLYLILSCLTAMSGQFDEIEELQAELIALASANPAFTEHEEMFTTVIVEIIEEIKLTLQADSLILKDLNINSVINKVLSEYSQITKTINYEL